MKTVFERRPVAALLAAALVAAGLVAGPTRADGKDDRNDRDHDSAWSAREGGATLSLAEVMNVIGPQIDGEIIETEFDYEDGAPVYEFKYVDRSGRVRKMEVDARTGLILEHKLD